MNFKAALSKSNFLNNYNKNKYLTFKINFNELVKTTLFLFNPKSLNNHIFYIFFYNFFYMYFFTKNNIIKFEKTYQNYFKKNNFFTYSFLYNIYVKKNLFFYKNFSKLYIKDNSKNKKSIKFKYKQKILKKNKFFKIKKTNYLNTIFLNLFQNINSKKNNFNFFRNKFFDKLSFGFILIDNIFFTQLNFLTSFKKPISNFIVSKFQKYKNYDLLVFYKNYIFNNFNLNLNTNNISNFKYKNPIKIYFNFKKYNNFFFKKICNILYSYDLKYFIFFFIFFKKIKKKYFIFFKNYSNSNNQFNNFKEQLYSIFRNIIYLDDLFNGVVKFKNNFLFSNIFFLKNLIILDNNHLNNLDFITFDKNNNKNLGLNFYNNYYPIFYSHKKSYKLFMSKFKSSLNLNYLVFINYYIIAFLEKLFKKRFFLKISNNYFNKPTKQYALNAIYTDYKNFQPKYMKNFSLKDFFEIIYYSFFLKDLSLLSEWFCKFMESVNFRFHKKFISFFHNFIIKNQKIFFDFFNLRGFFFDIRGKVGVTGNSKKRHHFFKIGKLNKSTKIRKINFKQSVVRTPSGVLGVTLIINY